MYNKATKGYQPNWNFMWQLKWPAVREAEGKFHIINIIENLQELIGDKILSLENIRAYQKEETTKESLKEFDLD